MTRFSTSLKLMAAVALILLAGCTTKPPANTAPPPVEAPSAGGTAPVTTESSSIIPGSAEDLRVNVGDTVHFDYDRYELRDEDRNILQRQASWLQKYAQVRVSVEGHCDERGTREYNLALGARRANAVKEYLVSLGSPRDDWKPSPMARSGRCARNRRKIATHRIAAESQL
ncbi:MAG: OmpA family protein [Rhizomicrobium sp.]